MTPLSFDIETAKEFIGADRVKFIEGLAAQDVKTGTMRDFEFSPTDSFMKQLRQSHELVVYVAAFQSKQRAQERKSQVFELDSELLEIVKTVIEQQSKAFEQYKTGTEKAIGAIVGGVMKVKRFDPLQVRQAIDSFK